MNTTAIFRLGYGSFLPCNAMNDIYEALQTIAAEPGGRGVLVEIESTEGSSPRKAGSRMLLGPDGRFSGTVGGGTLEYHAEQDARQVFDTGVPLRKTYALGPGSPGEAIGSICGGTAVLTIRPIGAAEADRLLRQRPKPPRVLLYGAGHVGKALCDALYLLGIPVTVTDEREAVLTPARFPHAERRLVPMASAPVDPDGRDMICIMTHGHAHDYTLLRRAMATDAAYIGVMASRTKAAMFRERLMQDGVSAADIARRLHSPIGLSIRAETPEEIAVSVAAELIAFLHAEGSEK